MFEDYPDILSPEEAADSLRIGENAIYELLNSKKLSAYKNGRNWLIPKEAVRKNVVEQSKLECSTKQGPNQERFGPCFAFVISSRIPCKVLSMLSL